MIVVGLAVDQNTGMPVLVLTDKEKNCALPIIIGVPEANAISLGLGNVKVGRPLTHELLLDVIDNLDYEVERVEITEVENQAYKSLLHLKAKTTGDALAIDARPSDVIAIAVRKEVPIFANTDLVTKDLVIQEVEPDENQEEFKEFIQNVKASDFKLDGFEPNLEELD